MLIAPDTFHLEMSTLYNSAQKTYRRTCRNTICLRIDGQTTHIDHIRDFPQPVVEQSVDSYRHSPTADLRSALELGVNSVTAYCRGHAVEVRVRARGYG